MRLRLAVLAAASLSCANTLVAQCSDGSPPPCRGQSVLATVDPHRVAVLPFRVTTADSLLGEGIAELLVMQLAHRHDAKPVHMGSLLRAWREAGGGLRSPLPIEHARRVSRSLGASRMVEGSVVGTGAGLTIAASLVSVGTGGTTPLATVRGHPDSLESLAQRLSVALLAAAGGEPGAARAYRMTDSPSALLAYFDGLSAWRRRRYRAADSAFERALAADSTFASAAFARLRSGSYNYQPTSRWAQLALRYQSRLTDEERAILHALLGETSPAPRTMAQRLAALEDLVRRFPESAEARYHLGDFLIHFGRALGLGDHLHRASEQLSRSVALDTQSTVFAHLIWATMDRRDTALLRRQWRASEKFFGDSSDFRIGWAVGVLTHDAALMARSARRVGDFGFFMINLAGFGVPASAIDSMFEMSRRAASASPRTWLSYANGALLQGRPDAALRALVQWQPGDSGAIVRDAFLLQAAVVADGDSSAADAAYQRLGAATSLHEREQGRIECARGLWDEHLRRVARWDDGLLRRTGWLNCAAVLGALRASRTGVLSAASLAETDSLLRERLDISQYAGIESLIIGQLWRTLGDKRRAYDAAARAHDGYPLTAGIGGSGTSMALATSALLAARLAVEVGDTSNAVYSYERYLRMRHAPEPRLRAQRDSAIAELARIRR